MEMEHQQETETESNCTASTSISFTLEELLVTECLSRVNLFLDHEASTLAYAPQHEDYEDIIGQQKKRKSLNCAKLSWLLVKSIVSHLSSESPDRNSLPSLGLKDFCVKLKNLEPASSSSPSSTENVGFPELCTSSSCATIGIGTAFPEKQPRQNQKSQEDEGELKQWIIVDIEIRNPQWGGNDSDANLIVEGEGNENENDGEQYPIEFVGKILHSIFSGDCGSSSSKFPPRVSDIDEVSDELDESNSNEQASKTRRRTEDNSVFTTLLETGEYPISVCRLLSDMTDDLNGNGNILITSLNDVIQDLQYMSSNPQVYLYDQVKEFYLTNLILGKGHYGRVNEMNTILEISNRIIEEAAAASPLDVLGELAVESNQNMCSSGRSGSTSSITGSQNVTVEGVASNLNMDTNMGSGSISGSPPNITRNQNGTVEGVENNPKLNTNMSSTNKSGFPSSITGNQNVAVEEVESNPNMNTNMCSSSRSGSPSSITGKTTVDAIFVSGAPGSGKSYFVKNASIILQNLGWMVLKVKFKRSLEYESKEIVSKLFNGLIQNLLLMRDNKCSSNVLDVDYSNRATRAISEALDPSSLSSLAKFLPSIRKLVPGIDENQNVDASSADVDMSHWQLVFLLSKLMGAILSLDRHIMICLDDLQWCDSTTIGLISEMLISVSQNQGGRNGTQHLMAMGMYRDDEVTESHPLTKQLTLLQKCGNIILTEIKLQCLSQEDVTDMIMAEMRLPRRLVRGLASIIHKKTSGHAIFIVQLLNSLVQDSIIAYSPRKHRFDWDETRIAALRTCESVASLIVSNFSALKPKALQSLRILSCFGVQMDIGFIKLLDTSPIAPQGGGIESFLPSLVERGVLEMPEHGAGPSSLSSSVVFFAHDLIQQHLYENIPIEERRQLHLDIGLFLGSMSSLDISTQKSSIESGMDHLYLSDGSSLAESMVKPLTLISIATDQVNVAGPQFITDKAQRTRFAGWNLYAGKEAAEHSNFQAALYKYRNGINFLTDGLWLGDSTYQQCRELHEGAAFASFALGNVAEVERYANAVIDHVLFEDSLIAQDLLIRSLKGAGKYSETIARGLAVLRLLNIDIPSAPSPTTVIKAMRETGMVTSAYTTNQINNLKQTSVNVRKRNILKIVDAIIVACYREASPFLPLVTCAMVNYSLQNGVYEESATAFVVYGYLKVFFESNFEEGRRWGDIALKIHNGISPFTPMTLYGFLLFWFIPHREVANILLETYEAGMRVGDVDTASYAWCLSLRFSLYGGEKLSILSRSYTKSFKIMAKYNQECLKYTIVDSLVIDGLTGIDKCRFSSFEGIIQNEDILLADSKHRKHNQVIESIYTRRFVSAFWRGDYTEASKWLDNASTLPSSKMPKIQLVYNTFYHGVMAFQMYRNGEGEEWLDRGKKALVRMTLWEKNCKAIFENKLILLEAEHYASMCNIVAAKQSYKLSAKTARDHGLLHEQALACELYAKFLSSLVETLDAYQWFQRAHTCYMQWGALAKADQLRKDHDLVLPDDKGSNIYASFISMKHERK